MLILNSIALLYYTIKRNQFIESNGNMLPLEDVLYLQRLKALYHLHNQHDSEINSLKKLSRQNGFRSARESFLLSLIFRFNFRSISYYLKHIYPRSVQAFQDLPDRSCYLFHHFEGSRLGILHLITYSLLNGKDLTVIVDPETLKFVSVLYRQWTAEEAGNTITLSTAQFSRLDIPQTSATIHVVCTDHFEGRRRLLRNLKKPDMNLALIPENSRSRSVSKGYHFMNAFYHLPESLRGLLDQFKRVYSVMPRSDSAITGKQYTIRELAGTNDPLGSFIRLSEQGFRESPRQYFALSNLANWELKLSGEDHSSIEELSRKSCSLTLRKDGKLLMKKTH